MSLVCVAVVLVAKGYEILIRFATEVVVRDVVELYALPTAARCTLAVETPVVGVLLIAHALDFKYFRYSGLCQAIAPGAYDPRLAHNVSRSSPCAEPAYGWRTARMNS